MTPWRVERAALGSAPLAGSVVTMTLRDAAGHVLVEKGALLRDGDRDLLARARWERLHLVRIDEGDLSESVAGNRLACAVAGTGVEVAAPAGGQWSLRASSRGILHVDRAALSRVNAVEDLSVYTLYDGQVVDVGETVARAKVIPFVVADLVIREAEHVCAAARPVSVQPFVPRRVAALVLESLADRGRERFHESFGEKVAWFGGTLTGIRQAPAERDAVVGALRATLAEGADIVVVAGTHAMDPLDPALVALDAMRAERVRRGVPAHPGSLCWLYRYGRQWVAGLPSCGVMSQATIFDLMLTWLFADMPVTSDRLAAIGHGGLLTRDMAFRFPPYRTARERGEVA